MGRPWRLEEFAPKMPVPVPKKRRANTRYCIRCNRYHYIYSEIGNEHKWNMVNEQEAEAERKRIEG